MTSIFCWLLFSVCSILLHHNVNGINYFGPIVYVPGVGKIQGISGLKSEIDKREYVSFLGVEYGEPPIGKLRFQPPLPRRKYKEKVYHANKYGSVCPQAIIPVSNKNELQFNRMNDIDQDLGQNETVHIPIIGEENCLVLDIHIPQLNSSSDLKTLPVLVYIHGGAFYSGSLQLYFPNRFMDQDIILVTMQYRLGPLGFLCLQIPEAPGNAGLYDQTLALQWIQKHISYFGGDPNQVTINGQSAGSASVSFHMISPLSKGLFHGIIGESGAAISPWAVAKNPVKDGMNFAQFAGCKTKNVRKAALCLQQIPVHDIAESYAKFLGDQVMESGNIAFVASTPCIQNLSPIGFHKFLSKPPIEILKSGNFNHVPALYGNVRDEGSLFVSVIYMTYLLPKQLEYNHHFLKYDFIKQYMDLANLDDPSGVTEDAFMRVYFSGLTMGDFQSMVPGIIDIVGAAYLKASTYETLKYNSIYNNSFYYSFDYEGEYTLNPFQSLLKYLIPGGVAHADELIYLYAPDFVFQLNETETLLSRKMIKMWTNFVRYGRPTINETDDNLDLPNWEPFHIEDPKFLRFLSPMELNIETNYPKLWTIEKDRALNQLKDQS